jgi:hypothetical protein
MWEPNVVEWCSGILRRAQEFFVFLIIYLKFLGANVKIYIIKYLKYSDY